MTLALLLMGDPVGDHPVRLSLEDGDVGRI
jgi:hypothetical protein